MLQSEHAIIRYAAAGEQKQGHGDAELLVKERLNSNCLGQPSSTNRPTKTLTRLNPAGPMAVQRNWKCPGSTGRRVPSWVLQIDSASSSFLLTRAMSCLSRSCSCSSGPATIRFLAAPRAAWRRGKPPGSESVQGSLFAGIDSVISLPAPGPPTTWSRLRPLRAGAAAWRRASLRRPPAPGHR